MRDLLPQPITIATHAVARRLGLDAGQARPLRVHDAATVALPQDHVVIRLVPQSQEAEARARRAVRLTGWLATQSFPTIRPAVPEPIEAEGYVATVWQEVAPHPLDTPVTVNRALGRVLRTLHTMPPPPVDLPTADPLGRLRAALRLDAARPEPALRPDEATFLQTRIDDLATQYAAMGFPLGSGLIHNDAHPGNLLPDPTSPYGYLLTDWEGACIGPRELDVVLVGAPGSRFGDSDDERLAFTNAYGYDVAAWPSYQTLRDIRDLHSLAAYVRTGPRKPAALAELRRRLSSLRDNDRTVRWTAV